MNRLLGFVVLLLAVILYVEAQKQKVERVPLSFHGDVCDKICSKKEGWDKCEKEKKRNEWEVTCTDTRKSGPGGKGGPGGLSPSGPGGKGGHGGPESSGSFNKGPGGHH
ncbi:unnamed protein product [Cylicocyclus nassatus]|uniref:Uncharacterized protein n=1 Tax=Cylicocyclus nassatus TaxID=53992 RepID=A0AA36GZG8_CYLNA|nr:unnamed protein product [Cylicocyclus nassatus]